MSGRDYDNTQKAIQALMLVNHYRIKAVDASRMMKIDKRMVSYASTIKGFNRQDILDVLLNNKDAKINLAISNEDIIIITLILDPENILPIPVTE